MLIAVTNRKLCRGSFLERIERLASAGTDAILLREKDLSEDDYMMLAKQCLGICSRFQTPLWLNSFPTVAAKLELPTQLPMPLLLQLSENQRQALPAFGASVHSKEDARLAQSLGASRLIAGHIFPTACKPDLPPRGISFLREICGSVSISVYAIGGISPDKQNAVRSVGAVGCCVMSQLMQCENVKNEIQNWRNMA